MKYNISIIGSCQSRDIFNSKFIPDYKEHFSVYSYYTMTSMLSVMSKPVGYNYDNLESCSLSNDNTDHWFFELEKPMLKTLATKKPDILLMDFYCEARYGAREYDGGYIVDRFSKLRGLRVIDKKKLGKEYNYTKNTIEFIGLWKQAFDEFMVFMRDNLPETKIVINTIKGNNVVVDKKGNKYISPRTVDVDLKRVNELWTFFDVYAINKYGLDAIRYDKEYTLDPDYIFGGLGVALVHFQHEYYNDCFRKLVELASTYDKCKDLSSELNLISNNDFYDGKAHWCHWKGNFKRISEGGCNALTLRDCRAELGEYKPQIWTFPIEIIGDGETLYELSFDIVVKNEIVLKSENLVVFGIRTFKYLKQYKYSNSLASVSLELDARKFKIEKKYTCRYRFSSNGKYVRLAIFMKKYLPGIEYSNIKLKYVGKPD